MDGRSKRTVLVTGASGFIGRNLVDHLEGEFRVLAPKHRELDLLSQSDVDRFFHDNEIDLVIHCANVGGSRKTGNMEGVVEKNLRMFTNLMRNEERFERLIHFGSGAEYDKPTMRANVSEEDFGKTIPKDDYGFSKYVISKMIEASDNAYCLRLFGVFGPHEDYEFKFISNAMVKNLIGMPIQIRQNVVFSWLYIGDLVRITRRVLDAPLHHRSYNVVPDYRCDLLGIARMINECSDHPSKVVVENPGLNVEYSGSNSRLTKELDDVHFTPMKKAIPDLFDHYRSIIDTLDTDVVRMDPYYSKCVVKK